MGKIDVKSVEAGDLKRLMKLDVNDPGAEELMRRICVPHAISESGSQEGVPPPWAVQYEKSKGKGLVGGDDAVRKYRRKIREGAPAFPVEMANVKIGENRPEDLDPFSTGEQSEDEDNTRDEDPNAKDERQTRRQPRQRRRQSQSSSLPDGVLMEAIARTVANAIAMDRNRDDVSVMKEDAAPRKSRLDVFKERSEVVRIKLQNGQVQMPCIAVIPDEYSITVILRSDTSGFTFVPDPGTDVVISWGGMAGRKAYFPGAQFTIGELGIMGLVFLADLNEGGDTDGRSDGTMRQHAREDRSANTSEDAGNRPPESLFSLNPETGLEEDEFGLARV